MKDFTYRDIVTLGNIQRIYIDYPADLMACPLNWQRRGLQQTASGYGHKLTSRYKIHYNGKMYRLYITIFGNAGSTWFIANGERICVS